VPDQYPSPAAQTVGCPGQVALDLDGATRAGEPESAAPIRGDLPEPGVWVAQFVRAAVEVCRGRRPPGQLARWASVEVQRTLERRHLLARRQVPLGADHPARVRVVQVSQPRPGVVEAAAVVGDRGRLRAAAVRLQDAGGRWRVTALELG
jgi:hypothetical protein